MCYERASRFLELQKETERGTEKCSLKNVLFPLLCIYIPWTIQALRFFFVLIFMTSKIPPLQSTFLIWSQEYQQESCMLCIHVLRAEMINSLHGLFSKLCLQEIKVKNLTKWSPREVRDFGEEISEQLGPRKDKVWGVQPCAIPHYQWPAGLKHGGSISWTNSQCKGNCFGQTV